MAVSVRDLHRDDFSVQAMLHLSGSRVLVVPQGNDLDAIPKHVLRWLGPIEGQEPVRLSENSSLPGVSAPAILYDLCVHGYCVIDAQDERAAPMPPRLNF